MRQPYELSVALRYLRARRRESFISFISLVSMIGIGLAVAVLIVVTSVMDGFEYELQQRILGVASHGAIYGEGGLEDWRALRARALARPDVTGAAPFVEGQGMAAVLGAEPPAGAARVGTGGGDGVRPSDADRGAGSGDPAVAAAGEQAADDDGGRTAPVSVRGVEPSLEAEVSEIGELMQAGTLASLEPGSFRMVIGAGLAETLGVGVGDELTLVLARGMVTPVGIIPRSKTFTVVGVFEAGMYEYDQGLALVHIEDAARLFDTRGRPSGLRIAVRDVYAARSIVRELAQTLEQTAYVTDWTRQHVNFFSSIRLSKSIMFVILSMVIAVAAFNIVSTLVMVVRDKRGDIAILRSFGAAPRSIMTVFASQGTMIGLAGTLLGLLLGLIVTAELQNVVALLEAWLDVDLLSAEVYWLGELPSRVRGVEVVRICGLALVLAIAATIYPALSAARQAPAEALRYE